MQITVDLLKSDDHIQYEEMMQSSPYAQLYTSLKYKDLLEETINAKSFYLLAKNKGELVGTLPLFLKKSPVNGNVLNSLPFYGCNGGITVKPGIDPQPVFKALIEALHSLAREMEVVVATIVTSPFERNGKFYEEYLKPNFQERNTGQICFFPEIHPDSHSNIENIVETMIRSKTNSTVRMRNVRKARNAGVTYTHSSDPNVLHFLIKAHKENMEKIGAPANRLKFLEKIPEKFEYDTDYRIYTASLNGQLIGALLLGYYNKIVEYMIPATKEEYLSLQPNSLLIFEAMKDAVSRSFLYWNFGGGASPEQKGVYQFKKRWGASDMPYYYYTMKYRDIGHLLDMKRNEILTEYPFFYVVPFSELRKKADVAVSK